jgi:hypothetical protein
MVMPRATHWKDKAVASAVHLTVCLLIAALAAVLVFGVWYPYPYREISGGRALFLIVVSVDVILGPLITLVVFNRAKTPAHLRMDLGVVAFVQLLGLAYGLWTVFVARPVHMVFEYDRFRVVHAIEVQPEELNLAPAGMPAMPLWGPSLLALRPFTDEPEKQAMTLAALQGVSLSARPALWRPYESARAEVLREAKPVAKLKQRFVAQSEQLDQAAASVGRSAGDLVYLPLVGRKGYWTVLLDPATAQPLAFLPLDSF